MEEMYENLTLAILAWAFLKLVGHKIFMYQRTIRKFTLKGIKLFDENNLYPMSYKYLLYGSMLRYVALGFIFYYSIWAGVICIVLGQMLTMFAPEQDDWDNLQKALKCLNERSSQHLIIDPGITCDRQTVLDISKSVEDNNLKITDIFRLYNSKTCLELVELFSNMSYWGEAEFYCNNEDIVKLHEGDKEERRPLYSWITHVSTKMQNCMNANFAVFKKELHKDWESKYKEHITEHQAAHIIRYVISMGAKSIVDKKIEQYAKRR